MALIKSRKKILNQPIKDNFRPKIKIKPLEHKSKDEAEKVSNVQDFYDNLDESSQDAVASRMEIQAQNQEIAQIDYEMEALKQKMTRRNAYERQVELIRCLRSRGGPTL